MSRIVIVGNLENRRVKLFAESAKKISDRPVILVSYLSILKRNNYLASILKKGDLLRIDSPGENQEVRLLLWKKAWYNAQLKGHSPKVTLKDLDALSKIKGLVVFKQFWFEGFKLILQEIESACQQVGRIDFFNPPSAILQMFDKWSCQQLLAKHSLDVPPLLGKIKDYNHLQDLLQNEQWHRVFVKPIYGSSASGVIAYRKTKDKEILHSSADLHYTKTGIQIFNSLKIQSYQAQNEIKDLINTLAKDQLMAERWLPKASLTTGTFDLRIVVINGKARHVVVRESNSPFTNLHLGNRRGDLETVQKRVGKETWRNAMLLAEKSVGLVDGAFYAGVDLMFTNKQHKPYVIELNAFGDLLPNLIHENENTYEAILRSKLESLK